jgi:hypothetical protein
VKTQTKVVRNCWRAMLVVAAVLGACGPVQEELLEEGEGLGEAEQAALTGVAVGISSGNIYLPSSGDQPLLSHNEQMVCEIDNLGSKWLRLEANVPLSELEMEALQLVVIKAKAKSHKVLVQVPARYCGADDDQVAIDAFTTAYVNGLSNLVSTVFTGPASVDAFEVGGRPNIMDQGCGGGVDRYRVSPNAFAWLLRRVWQWKSANAYPEQIVSGGIHNTYINPPTSTGTADPFWAPFGASAAFTGFPGSRPFDYFGIIPNNTANQDIHCINRYDLYQKYPTTCFSVWKQTVTSGLNTVATWVNARTGTTGTQLFVTEFGFKLATGPSLPECADGRVCCPAGQNCVVTQLQASAGMQAAGDAFVASGKVPVALYVGYRDTVPTRNGLRGLYDGAKYPAKSTLWNKFRSLAGGTGNTIPEACWSAGTNFIINFESGDDIRSTNAGDWAPGFWKGNCAPSERIMGLSKSVANGWARKAVCYKDPIDGVRYTHTDEGCYARDIRAGDNRGRSGPFDSANYEGECAAGEYVAGVAQSSDRKLSHILCCPAQVVGTACETKVFASANNRSSTATSGEWDADGYKGECGVGQYVAGVSRTPEGNPNAILCCAQ